MAVMIDDLVTRGVDETLPNVYLGRARIPSDFAGRQCCHPFDGQGLRAGLIDREHYLSLAEIKYFRRAGHCSLKAASINPTPENNETLQKSHRRL